MVLCLLSVSKDPECIQGVSLLTLHTPAGWGVLTCEHLQSKKNQDCVVDDLKGKVSRGFCFVSLSEG